MVVLRDIVDIGRWAGIGWAVIGDLRLIWGKQGYPLEISKKVMHEKNGLV
jgi:hypothetical protein